MERFNKKIIIFESHQKHVFEKDQKWISFFSSPFWPQASSRRQKQLARIANTTARWSGKTFMGVTSVVDTIWHRIGKLAVRLAKIKPSLTHENQSLLKKLPSQKNASILWALNNTHTKIFAGGNFWIVLGTMCELVASCTHWTWLIDSVGKKCCLKTSDGGITNLKWPGASGEKKCKE